MPTPIAVSSLDELFALVNKALEAGSTMMPEEHQRAKFAILEIRRRVGIAAHDMEEVYGAQDSATLSNLDCALNCLNTGKYDAR